MPVDKHEAYWYSCYTALATKIEQSVEARRLGDLNFEEALEQINDYLHPNSK